MTDKILIVGPSWVGDMVMAQSLFRLLKQRYPNVIIDILAPIWSLPLIERMPEISYAAILPFNHGELALLKRYQLGKNLSHKNYTQAIVLPNSFKSALIPFFANIPLRTGYRGEMRYGVLNDIRLLNPSRHPLMIQRFIALGLMTDEVVPANYPLPALTVSDQSRQTTLENFALNLSRPILALCPGAEFGEAKRWPPKYYADIANIKLEEGWDVWLFGSHKDKPVTKQITELTHEKAIDLAGRTQLEEAIDLLSCATLVISNDSGLMHVAAALDKPIIAIYGPTSATLTPPLHTKATIATQKLDCQPCFQRSCPLRHHRCMLELRPEKILDIMHSYQVDS